MWLTPSTSVRYRSSARVKRGFAATMLGDNEPARRLMRTFARRLQEGPVSHGVREVLVELAA